MTPFSALFNTTISFQKTSPVPYPFYMRDYEYYAHPDVFPWESRPFDVSLMQSNCDGNLARFEL